VQQTDGEPAVTWTGCVLTPETAASNSVAARSDGSLVMSASGASDTPMPSFAEIAELTKAGKEMPPMSPKGAVFTWSRADGWKRVPGSELEGNNGIELSRDGKWVWNNSWPGASVTHLPLDQTLGEKREVNLPFKPDNIRWSHDGKLVATGHLASAEKVAQCVMGGDAKACAIDYMAAEIDPDSYEVTEIFHGKGTEKFGTATITLKTARNLWIGSVSSKCIGRVGLKKGK